MDFCGHRGEMHQVPRPPATSARCYGNNGEEFPPPASATGSRPPCPSPRRWTPAGTRRAPGPAGGFGGGHGASATPCDHPPLKKIIIGETSTEGKHGGSAPGGGRRGSRPHAHAPRLGMPPLSQPAPGLLCPHMPSEGEEEEEKGGSAAAPLGGTAARGTGLRGRLPAADLAGARVGGTHLQTGSPSPPCTFGSQRQYPSESALALNTSP